MQTITSAVDGVVSRGAEFFTIRCIPLLGAMVKATSEAGIRALLAAGAVNELFTSNMKRGVAADRAAVRQLLWRLANQVKRAWVLGGVWQ